MLDAATYSVTLTILLIFAMGAIVILALSVWLVRSHNDQLVETILAHNRLHADELETRRQARRDRDARRATEAAE